MRVRAQSSSLCGTRQCPNVRFERFGRTGACSSCHLERSGGTRSVHFKRCGSTGAGPSNCLAHQVVPSGSGLASTTIFEIEISEMPAKPLNALGFFFNIYVCMCSIFILHDSLFIISYSCPCDFRLCKFCMLSLPLCFKSLQSQHVPTRGLVGSS